MARKKHPNKDIEAAIHYAETTGWRYKKAGNSAHAWGRLLCPFESREGCALSVWSTPNNPWAHAEQIKRRVKQGPHTSKEKS